jgi:hypothetical protein
MTSDLEQVVLSELDLNDQLTFSLEDLVFVPAEKKVKWAESPNADGAVLVEESHYGAAFFELLIRVVPAADTDTALAAVGTLMDKLQGCEQTEGGSPVEWTPNDSTRTYTAYGLVGEIVEVPITVRGDLAGWFVKAPILKVKLTCRPFLYTEERVVLAPVESKEPLQVIYLKDIGGDVPAEARAVITDKAAQTHRFVEFGQDVVESEAAPNLSLEADTDLTVEGLLGKLAVASGSISGEVVEVTLSQTPVAICSTGPISHVGSFRVKCRGKVEGEGAYFRASYRVGDSTWVTLPWVSITGDLNFFVQNDWFEVDLREAFLEEVEKGQQVSEVRIEGKVSTNQSNCLAYIDVLDLMPTRRYGVARAPIDFGTPTALLIADSYSQSPGGAATGLKADVGGIYAAATNSDTTDFNVSEGKLVRTAVSDTGTVGAGTSPLKGRGIGVPVELADGAVGLDFEINLTSGIPVAFGFIVGYTGEKSYTAVLIETNFFGGSLWVRDYTKTLRLKSLSSTLPGIGLVVGKLIVGVTGNTISVYVATGANGVVVRELTLENPAFGVKGKAFVYDENQTPTACTRRYDNLRVWKPEIAPVRFANQSVELRHDGVEREDSTGNFWAPVPEYRGSGLYLDPAGDQGLINRLAIKSRRNDLKLEPDSSAGLEDKRALEVLVSERFLVPR